MSQGQLHQYFKVSRNGNSKTSVKRLASEAELSTPEVKRHAHVKFSSLVDQTISTTVNDSKTVGRVTRSQKTENESSTVSAPPKPTKQIQFTPSTVKNSKRACSKNVTSVPQKKNEPTKPIAQNKSRGPAAHVRFKYLTEKPGVDPVEFTEPDYSPKSDAELTQTDEAIPPGLILPHGHQLLLELFRSCDTVVSMLHNRCEVCGFDKIKPAVQEIVRRNFDEKHVAQFLSVYPMAYVLRYDKQLDRYTRRPTGDYVLVINPNLRTDGTQMGHDSPSKGHLLFTGTRLIQRRNRFHRLLLAHVKRAHHEFLQTQLQIDPSEIPDDKELRRWHPRFLLDTMVPQIQPSPLPIRPSLDQKVLSARDAVKAFQARALFHDADLCQSVADATKLRKFGSIPSPSKASACSPRKVVPPASTDNRPPAVALFTSENQKPPVPSVPHHLKGVSEKLLAKVRARENERRLLTQLTQNAIPESRRAIYERLPSLITQVWTVMRPLNGRPLPLTTVASRIADAHPSGLSAAAVNEHLKVLLEFCPTWLETLDWASPHLRIHNATLSVKDVMDSVNKRLSSEGFRV